MTGEEHMDGSITVSINVTRTGRKEDVSIPSDSLILDLIRKLGEPLDGVIVLQNGKPIPLDVPVEMVQEEELKVISVASGG